MALVQGVRKAGCRHKNALGQVNCFHSSAWLQEKWRSKYKNKFGYDTDNGHKSSFSRSDQKDRRWTHRRQVTNKKTNDWEAYLKYEGDWERFCRKFTNLSDFEKPRAQQKGRGKKMWQEWDSISESEDEDEDDEDEDDSWDDDPTFGTHYKRPKPRVRQQQQQQQQQRQTYQHKTVVTVGQRADRLVLGLPAAGSLTMEELKAAFRAAALKWHPDRHQGSSKDTAEEKFKACGNAYRALCSALAESKSRC